MKKSIKAIIAATFTAALLAGCSSNTASTTTAAETTAAETTTAKQQLQDPQTQRIPLSQTVPTRSASTSSLFTALSTTAGKVSSKVSPRTDSWKAKILPY